MISLCIKHAMQCKCNRGICLSFCVDLTEVYCLSLGVDLTKVYCLSLGVVLIKVYCLSCGVNKT